MARIRKLVALLALGGIVIASAGFTRPGSIKINGMPYMLWIAVFPSEVDSGECAGGLSFDTPIDIEVLGEDDSSASMADARFVVRWRYSALRQRTPSWMLLRDTMWNERPAYVGSGGVPRWARGHSGFRFWAEAILPRVENGHLDSLSFLISVRWRRQQDSAEGERIIRTLGAGIGNLFPELPPDPPAVSEDSSFFPDSI
jgi:hypothetical protein